MSAPYDTLRFRLLTAGFNWNTTPLRLIAWSGVPSFVATDTMVGEIIDRSYAIRGYSQDILGKAVSATGVAQTGPVVIPSVAIGEDITWFTLVEHNLTPEAAQLLLFIDEALDLPFTPNGLDMVVQPDWIENRGWWTP